MADKPRQRRSGAKVSRVVQLQIRMTEAEYDEVKQAADAFVLDVSSYARSVLIRAIRTDKALL